MNSLAFKIKYQKQAIVTGKVIESRTYDKNDQHVSERFRCFPKNGGSCFLKV